MSDVMDNFHWLHGQPTSQGAIKVLPEHFVVKENLGFSFAGHGEHFMVKIRKVGENTKYVVNELAKACGVKSRDVSWAGLKDRHAVTEQWLSVHLPGKADPDLSQFEAEHPGVIVLETARHDKKLRPGDLQGNWFELRLTELEDSADILRRLEQVKALGVPNYFGEQRFGHGGNNVVKARAWGNDEFRVRDKSKRSFYLSAARSWLFNMVLSARIEQQKVHSVLEGDCLQAPERSDFTLIEAVSDEWQAKVDAGELAITIPMVGDNALPSAGEAEAFEMAVIEAEPLLLKLIRDNRMRHERRPALLKPTELAWRQEENDIVVSFALPAGCFATSVVRELMQVREQEGRTYANSDQ
ncbi:tRNA pseudouridine(13) synthase TruD [Photobacterium jeanii]|uniref:tRNA pseudouridine synthase D n=1 Tax=Photobacterium jeanii TaxID=858640 RepID=A0A178K698_9GAMM|nr:tRNA pseudouridine(13) synthase TruD [Photobacterium jeanii]OAN12596.1 tRNA pseudouridine(13) synthase TruD [Photobacterium jeanii]PST86738.1 tRNA pseudouridine(13) synthase TruD [Photobacterium jeanii]